MVVATDEDCWLMDGDVHLDEVERAIGHSLPRTDVETVAGLVIEEHGALPDKGDVVTLDLPVDPSELVADVPVLHQLVIRVLEVQRYIPMKLHLRLVETVATGDDS